MLLSQNFPFLLKNILLKFRNPAHLSARFFVAYLKGLIRDLHGQSRVELIIKLQNPDPYEEWQKTRFESFVGFNSPFP